MIKVRDKLKEHDSGLPCDDEPQSTIYTDTTHADFRPRDGMVPTITFHAPEPVIKALCDRFENSLDDRGFRFRSRAYGPYKPFGAMMEIVQDGQRNRECPYCDGYLDAYINVPQYKVRVERRRVRLCFGTKPGKGIYTGPVKLAAYGVDTVAHACNTSERTVRRWHADPDDDFDLYDLNAVARRITQKAGK